MMLLKKVVYDKSVEKVNNIDTCGFVLITKYGKDRTELENEIPDTSGRVKRQIIMLKSLKLRVKYEVLVG